MFKLVSQSLRKHLKPLLSSRLYSYEVPPHEWGKLYPIANGRRQSPINIASNDPGVSFKKEYKTPLQLTYTKNDINYVVNTGQSVMFYSNEEKPPKVYGGPLGDNCYKLVQFHFHWGSESHFGSEHLLNGRQFSAELHFVHMNTKYDDFDLALTKDDGLCVIGAFIDASEGSHNPAYQPVIERLKEVTSVGQEEYIAQPDIDCTTLLPSNVKHYAFYEGSLTTPPLKECVQWIVMLDHVVISEAQMEEFRKLKGDNDRPIVNNFRNIQSLFGRRVALHCCCCH